MNSRFALIRSPGKQSGIAYFGIFVLTVVSMALGAFLGERIALFSSHPNAIMNQGEFYATFALALSSVVALLVLIHRNFRLSISWPWFLLFFLLAVGNIGGTLCFGTRFFGVIQYRGDFYYYDLVFTAQERIQYILCFCLACVYFYLIFAVFPKILPHTRWLRLACWIGFLMAVASIVYSLVVEWNLYVALFDPAQKIGNPWTMSFTNNENTFGYLILMGLICLCLLHNGSGRLIYWPLILALGIFEILTLSATSVICVWTLIFFYGIYRFGKNVKRKPARSTMLLLILIAVIITLSILLFADPFGPNSFLGKIHAEIASYFGKKRSTFSTRVDTWTLIIKTLDSPFSWAFGIGDFQSRIYLGALHVPTVNGPELYPAHNAFMQCLIDGGLVRLGIYLVVLVRFFYVCVSRLGERSKIALPILLCFIALLMHGLMESTVFLSMDTKGFTSLFLLFMPLEIEHFQSRHPEIALYRQQAKADARKIVFQYDYSPLRFAKIAFFFLTPLFLLATRLGSLAAAFGYFAPDWSYYAFFPTLWLLGPLAYLGIGCGKEKTVVSSFFTFLFLLIIGAAVGGMFFNVWVPRISFIALIVICPLPFLFHAKTASISFTKALKTAYLPHLIIGGVLFGLTHAFLLIPVQEASIHIFICLGLALLLSYFGFLGIPAALKLGFPFADKLLHFDAKVVAKSILREEKVDLRRLRRENPRGDVIVEKRVFTIHPF